MKKTNAVWPNH